MIRPARPTLAEVPLADLSFVARNPGIRSSFGKPGQEDAGCKGEAPKDCPVNGTTARSSG
jgi:hypothetical protein